MALQTHGALVSVLRKVSRINETFETVFVKGSIVVANGVADMFYMKRILQALDYPVEVMTMQNVADVVSRFIQGNVRMIIISGAMLDQFDGILNPLAPSFDVVFLTEELHSDSYSRKSPLPISLGHASLHVL